APPLRAAEGRPVDLDPGEPEFAEGGQQEREVGLGVETMTQRRQGHPRTGVIPLPALQGGAGESLTRSDFEQDATGAQQLLEPVLEANRLAHMSGPVIRV